MMCFPRQSPRLPLILSLIGCASCIGFRTLDAAPPLIANLFAAKVAADPDEDYVLSEEHGPWLILAATFGGEAGRTQAHDLILELRSEFNLPAYLHRQEFDYSQPISGTGDVGERMRYANSSRYDAWAVLIGDFDAATNPTIDRVLDMIKHARPDALDHTKNGGKTSQRFAVLRQLARQLTEDESERKRGPMGSAFVTRNPLLPQEYFDTPEIDSFVRSLNDAVEHSLLDAEGKFTVVVKTFEGHTAIDMGSKSKSGFAPTESQLDHAAVSADKLCKELRRRGVEAYQFHDRYRSLVTVGTYNELGHAVEGGGFDYSADIAATIDRFRGAGEVMQTSYGTVMRSKATAGVVFDLQPRPIAIPKVEKSSLYLGGLLNSW